MNKDRMTGPAIGAVFGFLFALFIIYDFRDEITECHVRVYSCEDQRAPIFKRPVCGLSVYKDLNYPEWIKSLLK